MAKVYVLPADSLNIEELRKVFKKAKADARGNSGKDVQQVSKSETPE